MVVSPVLSPLSTKETPTRNVQAPIGIDFGVPLVMTTEVNGETASVSEFLE